MAKGVNTIYNLDVEINNADKMFNSFFNKENINKRKSKKKEQLIVKYDELFNQINEKRESISSLTKVKKMASPKVAKLIDNLRKENVSQLKKLQRETKKVRANLANLDEFTETITIKTSFGEIKTTYAEVYKNAGSTVEFFKKKLINQIKAKERDYKKEIKREATELEKLPANSKKAKNIRSYAKSAEKAISHFKSIIDQIKSDDNYPIMYEFNEKTADMRIYIVGWKGVKEYKAKKKKSLKNGKPFKFDYEDELKSSFKKK